MRPCVLGNGKLFLGFDPEARTREMFWPVVGLTNHVRESADNAFLSGMTAPSTGLAGKRGTPRGDMEGA